MNNPENWFSCLVCGKKTRFSYLKAQLCMSCGAFYRRSVNEKLEFECCSDERCKSLNGKASCRACRFSKCKQLCSSLNETYNERASSSSVVVPFKAPFQQSKLKDLISAYDYFLMGQRLLLINSNPKIMYNNEMLIEVNSRVDVIDVENHSIYLMMSMLHDYYRFFQHIPIDKQIDIAAQSAFEFFHIYRVYLTHKQFPGRMDHIMMTNGQYLVIEDMFSDDAINRMLRPGKYDEYFNMMKPISAKFNAHYQQFQKLDLQKRDVVCLVFLVVFKYIEYSGLLTEEIQRYHDELLQEWYEDLKQEYGTKFVTERFSKIMQYFISWKNLNEKYKDIMLLINLNKFQNDTEAMQELDYDLCLNYLKQAVSNTI